MFDPVEKKNESSDWTNFLITSFGELSMYLNSYIRRL